MSSAATVSVRQRIGRWVFPRLPVTRFLFDQLRAEANAALVHASYQLLPRRRMQLRHLRALRDQFVNVACGPHVEPGFVNLDLLPCSRAVMAWDCRRSLPLGDDAARGIRAEHFVEHLDPREELPLFLADARRALCRGGVLRVIVPDAARYLRAYCEQDVAAFAEIGVPVPFPTDLPTRMDVVNHVFHQWHEHRWAYDEDTVADRLRRAGFSRIERQSFGISLEPRLACDRAVHAPYSLYVDAVK